jgi:hypothetical protein
MSACITSPEKGKIMGKTVICAKQTIKIVQRVLGMQEIFLLKYVRRISRFLFLRNFALDNAGTEMLKHIVVAFIFSLVVLIQR